jgi:hypothetical protein
LCLAFLILLQEMRGRPPIELGWDRFSTTIGRLLTWASLTRDNINATFQDGVLEITVPAPETEQNAFSKSRSPLMEAPSGSVSVAVPEPEVSWKEALSLVALSWEAVCPDPGA